MEINKKIIIILVALSILLVFMIDIIDITKYFKYDKHIDSTISNTITFISILIGFISAIYVMVQQNQDSHVLNLLRSNDLLNIFNNSFKILMYTGFLDVFVLIFMNLVVSNIAIFKTLSYIVAPVTTYFLLSSINIITTICKMISAEEILKNMDDKV